MKTSSELRQFLETVRELRLTPKPSDEVEFEFTYEKAATDELKKIVTEAIKAGRAKIKGRKGIVYHEGDGYQEGWRETAALTLICEETPYGTITLPLKKIVLKPTDLTDADIDQLVEKIDIDSYIEHRLPPRHPFRKKFLELKKKEFEEYEKAIEQRKQEVKKWERENKEKLEEIKELYNKLSEEAKNELKYLIDPYDGLFGLDPTIEQLIKIAEKTQC